MWHFPNRHLPSSSMPGSSVTSRACPPMIPASGAEPIAILDRTPGDDGPGLPQAGAVTAATRVGVEPGVSRAEPTTSLAVAGAQAIAISVVVPTFNEADNVGTLVERLEEALAGRRFEVLIVDDDSPDLTWQRVETLARTRPWLGCYRRIGTRGLSSAVIDGLVRVTGSALVVIDADLQHDPALVPMLAAQLDQAEVAVASRYTAGGETCGWSWMRLALSRGATLMARLVLGAPTSDPMSGCFAVRRSLIERIAQDLQPRGYKILMEILYRGGVRRVAEVPYRFGLRLHGDSKLTGSIAWDFLASMWDLRFGAVLPVRFLKYCVVGASGVGIQLMVTHLLRQIPALHTADSAIATAAAICCAMVSNYALDNAWAFGVARHRWGLPWLAGFASFALVCTAGAVINWSVTIGIRHATGMHMNVYFAQMVGIAVATLWNYALNTRITWKSPT